MADEVRLIDANALLSEVYGDGDLSKKETRTAVLLMIEKSPTIKAQPVGTEKCKALRNIEGIRLILSNVYNTGSTLQDCDYDAIYKRLDVIENILKG